MATTLENKTEPTTELASVTEGSKLAQQMKTVDISSMPTNMDEVIFWAKTLNKMGVPGLQGEGDAAIRILIGKRSGMDPVSAVHNIFNVKGKHMKHYSVLLGELKKTAKYTYRWIEVSDTRVEIEFFELVNGKMESIGKHPFTIEEARKQGTQNLDKIPQTMLCARATGQGIRLHCADAFNGMVPYAFGEIVEDVVAVPAATKSESLAAEMQAKAGLAKEYDEPIIVEAEPEREVGPITGEVIEGIQDPNEEPFVPDDKKGMF